AAAASPSVTSPAAGAMPARAAAWSSIEPVRASPPSRAAAPVPAKSLPKPLRGASTADTLAPAATAPAAHGSVAKAGKANRQATRAVNMARMAAPWSVKRGRLNGLLFLDRLPGALHVAAEAVDGVAAGGQGG